MPFVRHAGLQLGLLPPVLLLSAIEVILRAPGASRAHCCQLQIRHSGSLFPLAHLHLIPDNHTNIPPLSFLQAGCPSCCPTNSVKALKHHLPKYWIHHSTIAFQSRFLLYNTMGPYSAGVAQGVGSNSDWYTNT